jgi:hypothetical protein
MSKVTQVYYGFVIPNSKCVKKKSKGISAFEALVCVGHRIPHLKDSLSLLMVQYSKDTCVKKRQPLF